MSGLRGDMNLIPGWGMGPRCWGPMAEQLETRYRLQYSSLPGHGVLAPRPAWKLSDVAAELLAELPAGVWLGWSLGAQLALQLARLAPERVRALVLLGATPRFLRASDWPHAMAPAVFDAFKTSCCQDPVRTLRRFQALQVKDSDHAVPVLRSLRQNRIAEPECEILADALAVLQETDLRPLLAQLEVPCLWLHGSADQLVPAAAAEAAAASMPGAQLVIIQGAGHAPFLSHPQASANALHGFLSSLP